MKVDEKKLGCNNCRYRNGYVCNICWKKVYKEFYEGKEKDNGIQKENKQNTNEI